MIQGILSIIIFAKAVRSETMLNGYEIIALCLSRIQDATSISFVAKLNAALRNCQEITFK
ncbi:MAG: hypothetical protein K2G55_00100 [Lachnospiraceae bacterium]|nr:hypothetical protein [Lachnospiraceae bacterium]MDE7201609.1 hypothetical protein [Lachnospiraceae bacterium]